MVAVGDLERITGYRRGGVTVIGAKKRLPVYLDTSAVDADRIAVSAGAPGLQVVLAAGRLPRRHRRHPGPNRPVGESGSLRRRPVSAIAGGSASVAGGDR